VACGRIGSTMYKFALDKAYVVGKDIASASATPSTTSTSWDVNLNFKGNGTKQFGDLTTRMYDKYTGSQAPPNWLGVVLDGVVVSAPYVQTPTTNGNTLISGSFSQTDATNLANQLSYGALPLTFAQESVQSVSPQLGRHHRGLVRGLLRTPPRRGERRALATGGGGARLDPGPADHPGLRHGVLPGRRAAVLLRDRQRPRLRLHPRPDHHHRRGGGVHLHQADDDAARPDQVLRRRDPPVRPRPRPARGPRALARNPAPHGGPRPGPADAGEGGGMSARGGSGGRPYRGEGPGESVGLPRL